MMNWLFIALQVIAAYIGAMVVVGMIRDPRYLSPEVVVIGCFYVINLLVTRLCHQAQQRKGGASLGRSRNGALIISGVLALGSLALGACAVLEFSPSEPDHALSLAYVIAGQFAGYWSVALYFYVIAAMFSLLFYRILSNRFA
jgi:hypothetical protein